MKSKIKINLIVVAVIFIITATIYVIRETGTWMSYSEPLTVNNVVLDIYQAQDYPVEGNKIYFYKINGNIRYSRGFWPIVHEEILKSDTFLVLHKCDN